MNPHVNAIAGRLSLRKPQRTSLEILGRVTEIAPPRKEADLTAALEVIRGEYPNLTDFEREFPSLCFALATGVGKTRLMGAFIAYLHLARGMHNFFVLAPNLTIYDKLIADFTPNTPKYVFQGIAEFAQEAPVIITGENYNQGAGVKNGALPGFGQAVHINIFNISKINTEVRGGRSPRIKRLSEYIGESYFDYLAGLDDLVLLMDESHRYRATAGAKAINDLRPVLGLELTATPFIEVRGGTAPFRNVVYDYPLAQAINDGFVKKPAVATQQNFDARQFTDEQVEQFKLVDGIRLHEDVKVHLETYARETSQQRVKPFALVIARDTTHAAELLKQIESDEFFDGRYRGKVIQVDSSRTGADEEKMIEQLLHVEHADDPTEIVIHVNMLKEGWDVTNLYTIIPLRAANARTLIEQSIGRGLRLPYGKLTGVEAVDRLTIVAHDRFEEIVEAAKQPDSVIRLGQVILPPTDQHEKLSTVVSKTLIAEALSEAASDEAPLFNNESHRKTAQVVYEVILEFEHLPTSDHLLDADVQKQITSRVQARIAPATTNLPGTAEALPIGEVVAQTTAFIRTHSIDIPTIRIVPRGDVISGFHPFKLDASSVQYQPVERDILIQHLSTHQQETLSANSSGSCKRRLEDDLVQALADFDDVSYDEHADLLYDLAEQAVSHLRSYLHAEEAVANVLQYHRRRLASLIHAQMQSHHWEKVSGYDVVVSKGFTAIKPEQAFTVDANSPVCDFRDPVTNKSRVTQMVFGGFQRCLYTKQKFDSDTERLLSVILDRDAEKWFRPGREQFEIYYRFSGGQHQYQPDFVAETDAAILMLEPKALKDMTDDTVQAKKDAAVQWCQHATNHNLRHGRKPWKYALIPHNEISLSRTLDALVKEFGCC